MSNSTKSKSLNFDFQVCQFQDDLKYKLEYDLLKKSYVKKESVVKR